MALTVRPLFSGGHATSALNLPRPGRRGLVLGFGLAFLALLLDALLHPRAVAECGVFDPDAVSALLRRCRAGRATGTGESQMLVAVLTTQLWHRAFLGQHQARATSRAEAVLVSRSAPAPFLPHATPGGSR
jgi:hypothetical protein